VHQRLRAVQDELNRLHAFCVEHWGNP
jgi:hypothetical protein